MLKSTNVIQQINTRKEGKETVATQAGNMLTRLILISDQTKQKKQLAH